MAINMATRDCSELENRTVMKELDFLQSEGGDLCADKINILWFRVSDQDTFRQNFDLFQLHFQK